MVPEIWSATDRIFYHFQSSLPFYPPNNPKNQNFEEKKKKKEKTAWRYYHFTQI